jgi:hypothetical protein
MKKPVKAWAVMNAEDIGGFAADAHSCSDHLPIFKLRRVAQYACRASKGQRVVRVEIRVI